MIIKRTKTADPRLPNSVPTTCHYAATVDKNGNVTKWVPTIAEACDCDKATCDCVLARYKVRGKDAGVIEVVDPSKKAQETVK